MYGKSYGAKKFGIEQFLKKRSQFLYLRRYDNELKEIFEKTKSQKDFFDDIKEVFKDHKLEAKNRKFYIDDECFGFAKRMTEAQDLKSSDVENSPKSSLATLQINFKYSLNILEKCKMCHQMFFFWK